MICGIVVYLSIIHWDLLFGCGGPKTICRLDGFSLSQGRHLAVSYNRIPAPQVAGYFWFPLNILLGYSSFKPLMGGTESIPDFSLVGNKIDEMKKVSILLEGWLFLSYRVWWYNSFLRSLYNSEQGEKQCLQKSPWFCHVYYFLLSLPESVITKIRVEHTNIWAGGEMKGVDITFPFQATMGGFDKSTIHLGQDMMPIKHMKLNFWTKQSHTSSSDICLAVTNMTFISQPQS